MKFRFLLCFGLLILISGCMAENRQDIQRKQPTVDQMKQVEQTSNPLPSAVLPTPTFTSVKLAAIGDILVHNRVYEEALQSDGSYNFKAMFDDVKGDLHVPEIVVANEESNIGGIDLGLSSYPTFNSPYEVGDALQYAGVNLVTMANNHIMDRGEKGIQSALAYWDKIGMPYTGAFKSQQDRDTIRTLTKHDITFAFLAYTFGTNGIAVPKDKPFLVNLIQEQQMKIDIAAAKKNSDVVVVSVHWGIENQTLPTKEQTRLARALSEMGADIIIGTHPHVLQPFAWIERSDGNKTLVMYSLGNFLSAQDQPLERIGGIGEITITKTINGNTKSILMTNPTLIPTYMYYESSGHYQQFKIYLMDKMDERYLKNKTQYLDEIKTHMSLYIPEMQYFESQ